MKKIEKLTWKIKDCIGFYKRKSGFCVVPGYELTKKKKMCIFIFYLKKKIDYS